MQLLNKNFEIRFSMSRLRFHHQL